jgi:hypothetical protein
MFYVGFSSPKKKKIGAELIKWWTGSPYSHVYIRFESSAPDVPSTMYHAAHGMVHFLTKERFEKQNTIVVEYPFDVTSEQRKHVLIKCMNISGERYGYTELIKIFILDLAKKISWDKLEFHNSKGYICSELVAEILEDLYQIKWDKPKYTLYPKDIEKAIIDICGKK